MWRAIAAFLLFVLMPASAPPARAQADGVAAAWTMLEPPGGGRITAIALSASWPTDPTIIATRVSDLLQPVGGLVRSRDGGVTWDALPPPDDVVDLTRITVFAATSYLGDPRLFLVARIRDGADTISRWRLYMSRDLGASWRWWEARQDVAPRLTLSPSFDTDGIAFIASDGQLARTGDGGLIWRAVDVAPDQWVATATLSPNFAVDTTLFVAARSRDPDDPDLSVGVLASSDGGATWYPAADGLQVDNTPYRHVEELVVSPTYAEDGTLFAYASIPAGIDFCLLWRERGQARHGAIFRSTDRGGSWTPVQTIGRGCIQIVTFAVSPYFASDGLVLVSQARGGSSPASSNCRLLRSDTWGDAWSATTITSSYGSCLGLRAFRGPTGTAALIASTGNTVLWQLSLDGGASWRRRPWHLASGVSATPLSAAASPSFATDRVLFVGSPYGIGRYGPVHRPDGSFGCPFEMVGGFGRVWQANPDLREDLDCPREAERPARIIERQLAGPFGGTAYVVEGETFSFGRYADGSGGIITSSVPEAELPDVVMDGAFQTFEAGWMLWLPRPDGTRRILVLVPFPVGRWYEFPD